MNILSIGIQFFQLPLLLSWLQLPTSQQLDQMRYPQHPTIPVPMPMYLHNNNNNNNPFQPFQPPLKRFSPLPFNFHNIFSNIKHFFNNPQQQQQQQPTMSPRLMQLLTNPQNQLALENFLQQQTKLVNSKMASNNVQLQPQGRRNHDGPPVFTPPYKMEPEMMDTLVKMAEQKRKVQPRPHLALQLIKDVALPNIATSQRQLGRQLGRQSSQKEQMELFEMLAKHYRIKDEEEKAHATRPIYAVVEPRTEDPHWSVNAEKLKAVLNEKTNELLKLKKVVDADEESRSSSLASMMADNRPEEISLIRKLLLKLDQHELNVVGKLIHVVINKPSFLPRILQENLSDDVKHVLQVIQVLKFPQTLVDQNKTLKKVEKVETVETPTITSTTAIPIQKKSWKGVKTSSDKSLIPLVYWLDDKNERGASSGARTRHGNRFEDQQSGGRDYLHGRVDQRRLSPNYRAITENENHYTSPRVSPSYSGHTSLKATESKPTMYKISMVKQSLPDPSTAEIPDRYRKVLQDGDDDDDDGKWRNTFQSTDWKPMKKTNKDVGKNNYYSHPVAYFQPEVEKKSRLRSDEAPEGFREGKRLRFKEGDVQSEESGTYLVGHPRKHVEGSWENERSGNGYGKKMARKRLKSQNSGENSWESGAFKEGWWNSSLVPCLTTTGHGMSSEDREMYETSASISSLHVVTPYGTTKWEENYGNDVSIRPENKVNKFTTEATIKPVLVATIKTKTSRNPVSSTTVEAEAETKRNPVAVSVATTEPEIDTNPVMEPETHRYPVPIATMGLETDRNPVPVTTDRNPVSIATMERKTDRNPVPVTTMERKTNRNPVPITTIESETDKNPVPVTTMESENDGNPVPFATIESENDRNPVLFATMDPEKPAKTNNFGFLNEEDIIPIISPFPVYVPEVTSENSGGTNQFLQLEETTTSAHILVSLETDVGNKTTTDNSSHLENSFNNGKVFSTINNPHSDIVASSGTHATNKAEEMELMQRYFPAGYWPKVAAAPPASTMAKNNSKRKIKLRWFDTEDNNRHNRR